MRTHIRRSDVQGAGPPHSDNRVRRQRLRNRVPRLMDNHTCADLAPEEILRYVTARYENRNTGSPRP